MVKNSSSDPNPRQTKKACVPQFRATRSRNKAADTSTVLSVHRSTAGNIRTQERGRQRPASLRIPEEPLLPLSDPSQDHPTPPSPRNLPPSPSESIEVLPSLKRKCVYTNQVTLSILYLTPF
jgi:hypothetical protein